jgi:hypothetical protein
MGLGRGFRAHTFENGRPKTSYMTEAEANAVAEEKAGETGALLVAYRCPVCDAWHLGRSGE